MGSCVATVQEGFVEHPADVLEAGLSVREDARLDDHDDGNTNECNSNESNSVATF